MNSSIVLIINPLSGNFSQKKLSASVELLKKKYRDISFMYTRRRGDAEMFAREALQKSPEMILVAGGDGTFNEVANGAAFSGIPLAFLPSGTTNVLARELSLPDDMYEATLRAIHGRPDYISLGRINGRYFVLMAGVGFDGEAVYGASEGVKKVSGKGAYILSGLRAFVGYQPERLNITIDEDDYEGYGLIVCNARYYAGNFMVCPDADIRSEYLSIFIMHVGKRIDLLTYIWEIIRGRTPQLRSVTCRKGKSVAVSEGAHIQIDGDYLCMSPIKIACREGALRIVV
jgi:YegS/Rv2252/BmrU family lipid kinase